MGRSVLARVMAGVLLWGAGWMVGAHVTEGTGQGLQFYSYRTNSPPTINSSLTRSTGAAPGDNSDEWKDAYIRHLVLENAARTETTEVTLLFMNDGDNLYIGATGNMNNLGNNVTLRFYFDQGVGGGSHDDALQGGGAGMNNGEYELRLTTDSNLRSEYSFNGTTWEEQNSGVDVVFTGQGDNYGTSFYQAEFSIPLSGNPAASDGESYLNVDSTDELGLYVEVHTTNGGGEVFYWHETGGDPDDASAGDGWIDLRLGVDRSYVTFYSTYNANGNPIIDGNIGGEAVADDAWRGCYTRNLTLTNFEGGQVEAILYAVEDNAGDSVYIGVRVYDAANDPGDYCQIYQEVNTATPATGRNFLLDDGEENALVADENAYTDADDRYWSGGAAGSWAQDINGGGTSSRQTARGKHYTAGYYEYEFVLDRGSTEDTRDIRVTDGSTIGLLVKYHDAADGTDYFWEYSPNADKINIDPNNNVYLAAGWPGLQFGAPYMQVVFPQDNADLEGVVNVRIYATDGVDGVDSACFYRKSNPDTRYSLTKVGTTDEWAGVWNVQDLSNGADTIVFEASDGGITLERLVNVTIANGVGSTNPPSITLDSPTAGSTLSDTVTIQFTPSATVPATVAATDISVDGGAYSATTTASSHTWVTQLLADGTHTIRLKVTDSNGSSTTTDLVSYITSNAPSVSITAPSADSVLSDTVTIAFTATPASDLSIAGTAISVDGGAFVATTTATSHTLATGDLEDGAHTIRIRATDNVGRTALSEPLKVNVANAPTVAITSPSADSTIRDTLTIAFTVSTIASATVSATEISVDGGAYVATTTGAMHLLATGSLTDGAHTIVVRATDSNDKTGISSTLKVNVANTPTVTIDSPPADSTVEDTVTVVFAVTTIPSAAVSATEISVDGAAFVATTTDSTHVLPTGDMADGAHTIVVRATDSDGKTGTSSMLKFNSLNNPAVSITAPAADSTVRDTITVSFNAVTISSATVDSTWICVDGGAYTPTTTSSSHTLATADLEEGAHTLQIKIRDSNGNEALSPILKINAANSPSIAITSPAADSTVRDTVMVAFDVSLVPSATIGATQIAVDGGAFTATTTDSTHALPTGTLPDGAHMIVVRVTDSYGRSADSRSCKITTANSPSVVLTAPTPDSLLSGTVEVLFSATAIPSASIVRREVYIDGGLLDTTTAAGTYSWNTLAINDGQHAVQVRVLDSNGKRARSETVLVTVHNTPVVTITQPAETTVVSGVDTIRFTVDYAPGDSRDTTEVSFDGGGWVASTGALSHAWITTDFLDGSHTVQVRATGGNGKTGYSRIRHYLVDNRPRVAIDAPLPGAVVAGLDTVEFSAVAVSPAAIIKREISIDGGSWTDSLVDSASRAINTVDWEDGTHSVQVRATDNRGHVGHSQQVLFVTRNAPSVAVLAPEASDTLDDTILVRFRAEAVAPAVIESTLVSVDGGAYRSTDTDSTARIFSGPLADGSHVFKLKVKDDRGKVGESDERLFVVDNAPPIVADPKVVYPDGASTARRGAEVLVTVLVKDLIAGLDRDSAVVLTSKELASSPVTYLLHDDGQEGDVVAGDHVFSSKVTVDTDSSGRIAYTVRGTDRLRNSVRLEAAIILDNQLPRISCVLEPEPEIMGAGTVLKTYFDKLVMKGSYSDPGGAGLAAVFVAVRNDSGKHVNNSPIDLSLSDSLFSRVIHLVPDTNRITLSAADHAGNDTSVTVTVVYLEPKATKVVDAKGGEVESPDGAGVVVPKHALLGPVEITITKVDPIEQPKPLDPDLVLLNVGHDFGPDGAAFRKPVTLTLAYTEADLDKDQDGARDIDPLKLTMVFWDGETWRSAGKAEVDTAERTVSVAVNHFTMYDLAVNNGERPRKLKVYWTHNPVRAGKGSFFTYEIPKEGKVSLRILDLAGDLVYTVIPFETTKEAGSHSEAWYGQNVSERFAGAGLYVYVFTYNDGSKSTVIRKPVGVLK